MSYSILMTASEMYDTYQTMVKHGLPDPVESTITVAMVLGHTKREARDLLREGILEVISH